MPRSGGQPPEQTPRNGGQSHGFLPSCFAACCPKRSLSVYILQRLDVTGFRQDGNAEDRMKLAWWSIVTAVAFGVLPAQEVRAQDKPVVLKFSHWVPPTHPMHASAVAWGESIEKASNGTIKVTIFPAQQLGKAFDHYNMARDGIADITHVNP